MNTDKVSDASRHLIRSSVDIDPSAEGALYTIRLAQDKAHKGLMSCGRGSMQAAEWLVLLDHLDDLSRKARIAADERLARDGYCGL